MGTEKSISFQLFADGNMDFIGRSLNNKMGQYPYECDNILKTIQCLQEVVLEETRDLFVEVDQDKYVNRIIKSLEIIDKKSIKELSENLGGKESLLLLYRKTIDVFLKFMEIYEKILPAETYMNYMKKEKLNCYMSTCSFSELKTFYQDSYEVVLSMLYIPVCLDNIKLRGNYQKFSQKYEHLHCPEKNRRDLKWYMKLENGKRYNKYDKNEEFQKIIDFSANRYLRNGIGHNNIKYDKITQEVMAYDLNNPQKITYKEKLICVALECIGLMKTSIIMAEIILFMLRNEYREEGVHSIIHPRFYKKVQRNDKCPCGSGLKFKRCCQNDIEKICKGINLI